jgi:hypothetical protein
MWQYSRLSILGFGVTAFVTGLFTLARPEIITSRLSISPDGLPSIRGNGLSALAMGLYYILAAYQNNQAFFKLSVPMRLLSTYVFWRQQWIVASAWEGCSATFTALTLYFGL